MEPDELKTTVAGEIDARSQELSELSLKIHSNPELAFRAHLTTLYGDHLEDI